VQHLNQESLDDPEPKSAPGVAAGWLLNCDRAADRGCVFFSELLPSSFFPAPKAEKSTLRMVDPGGRLLGPEPDFGRLFEFQGERERGRFLFSKACKSFIGADSKKLKMRHFAAY
jgi:hypothetical protein